MKWMEFTSIPQMCQPNSCNVVACMFLQTGVCGVSASLSVDRLVSTLREVFRGAVKVAGKCEVTDLDVSNHQVLLRKWRLRMHVMQDRCRNCQGRFVSLQVFPQRRKVPGERPGAEAPCIC